MKTSLSLQVGVNVDGYHDTGLDVDVEFEHTNARRWMDPPEWNILKVSTTVDGFEADLDWLLNVMSFRNSIDEAIENYFIEQDTSAREREEERRGSYDE